MNDYDIHNEVRIEPWTRDYLETFEREKRAIDKSLSGYGLKAAVYHVGGTSIPGLSGKEIIDILVCPGSAFVPEDLAPALESIGYTNLGECCRPGRLFMVKGDKPLETFYLHLCGEDNQVARDQLLFKAILEGNAQIRQRYSYAKHLLEDLFPEDRNMYRELKGLFVEGVLSGYRFALEETVWKNKP